MITLKVGDCRNVLASMPDGSVHCCVTSPPYFGLRDYGTGHWEGGDPNCPHKPRGGKATSSGLRAPGQANGHAQEGFRGKCPHCGAVRVGDSQIGMEESPQAFVDELVAVFREVRRVLRNDGTLWLNLGDSYATAGGAGAQGAGGQRAGRRHTASIAASKGVGGTIKPKDLIGIPWRVAFALQEDGWWLRQDIVWHKPNPMPQSVTDRCTTAHEYIFLLSKSPRYFYDANAIREQLSDADVELAKALARKQGYDDTIPYRDWYFNHREGSDWVDKKNSGDNLTFGQAKRKSATKPKTLIHPDGANKRSVWSVCPKPYTEAHFATYPPELIEPCIKAGCPAGGVVLDPFGGAGTTGLVADRLGRDAVLIELNPQYAALAEKRLHDDGGMLLQLQTELHL